MQISRAKDMKAEQNDAPQHLRTKKKKNPLRFLAIIGIGSTLFWTLTMMFGKSIVIDLDQIKRGIRFADQPVSQHAPQTTNAQPVAQPQALQEVAREESPQTQTQTQTQTQSIPRQTSFNDQNYQPRGAVNSIPPPPAQRIAYAQPDRPANRQTTRITHTGTWTWESGHAKSRTGGRFQWTVINGSIDWSSVCSNYRSGSLEYRDCRKGAKVAFRQICNRNQAACAAENNFMP